MKLFTGWVDVGRAGSRGHGRKCAGVGAIRMPAGRRMRRCPTSTVPMRRCRREAPAPRYGPMLLPARGGLHGGPRERVFAARNSAAARLVYTIAVIDRGGDDGRLVIDARTGRIIRFMPAYRMGDNLNEDLTHHLWSGRAAAAGQPRQGRAAAAARRCPGSRAARLRCRCRKRRRRMPRPKPLAAKPAAEPAQPGRAVREPSAAASRCGAPQPPQQSAAVQAKPAAPETTPQAAAPAPVEAKPARDTDPADAGNAEGAGAGVKR